MAQANARGDEPGTRLARTDNAARLLRDLVAHLREKQVDLCAEWVKRILEAHLTTVMRETETLLDMKSVYELHLDAVETGAPEAFQAYVRNLSDRVSLRGVETGSVVGIVLLLNDVLGRSLIARFKNDITELDRALDVFEPAANKVVMTAAARFVQERERLLREQQDAMGELSTPVLQVKERLLLLPIGGVIDPHRARQLTEQLLNSIRDTRAKAVVIDITGVTAMDSGVANHLVQTVEASRLLGASVIVTGLSPEIAQTLVRIGVDLAKMTTVGDLQGGIEAAERLINTRSMPNSAPPAGLKQR